MFEKWHRKKPTPTPSIPAQALHSPASSEPKMIKVFDKFGREMLISSQEWLDKVLPGHLEKVWDDASQLYDAVAQALRDGFEAEPLVRRAARHLYELEPSEERGVTVYGIILLKNAELKEAQELYETFIQSHPNAPYVMTNLAKIYSAQGNSKKSEETLWQALVLDPNQDNAVGWWAVIHKEREGMNAYLAALKRVAALPASWYAPSLIAAHLMQTGEKETLCKYFASSSLAIQTTAGS